MIITNESGNAIGVPANPMVTSQTASGVPQGATGVQATSGVVAAATATATLPAVSAKTNYLTGFDITGLGATAGSTITATIVGLLGGTRSYPVVVPAGVTVGITPLVMSFSPPLAASAVNIAIVVSVPTFGAGNTFAQVNAQGYVV